MMKRFNAVSIAALILALCCLFSGCGLNSAESVKDLTSHLTFDPETEGIVKVSTEKYDGSGITAKNYFVIGRGRQSMSCEPFAPDEATVYYVADGCIESYIDEEKNAVLNRLVKVMATDEDGNALAVPTDFNELFIEIAKQKHDMPVIRIFDDGGEYFVFVILNVNLWTPCDLYYYDREAKKLTMLYESDGDEVTGIHIISSELLHALG